MPSNFPKDPRPQLQHDGSLRFLAYFEIHIEISVLMLVMATVESPQLTLKPLCSSDLCDVLITCLEESCWVCISNCVWFRKINKEEAWARVGLLRHREKVNRKSHWSVQLRTLWAATWLEIAWNTGNRDTFHLRVQGEQPAFLQAWILINELRKVDRWHLKCR